MSTAAPPIAALHRAVLDDRGPREGLVAFTVEAPIREPLRLVAAATDTGSSVGRDVPTVFWDDGEGPTWVGLRTAYCRRVTAEHDARQRKAELAARIGQLRVTHLGEPLPWPVRAFGGLSFESSAKTFSSDWAAFGAGYFTIPRWNYVRSGDRAWLMVVLDGTGGPLAEQAESVLREGHIWFDALHAPWQAARPAQLSMVRAGRSSWNESVQTIRDGVRQGTVQKAVLTRDTVVRAKQRLDPSSLLWRLTPEPTGSVRFAFSPEGRQGPTFAGLTPERLVRLQDHALVTEALAGTSRDEAHQKGAEALLTSTKDREEHMHVVQFIMDRLGPLCVELEHGTTNLHKLRHVTHLKTPITGRLSASMHVLDVVRALHPTPAIGGVPLAAARAMIERLEGRSRGWYTGPVGWFDGAGNGDFWVALRSGLVIGERARVFVGAGIVRESDPDVEWEETLLKERTILSGLGAPT